MDFFAQRAHTVVPSSPVVPHDDPTLLFTNAGMNQFKPLFLGQVEPGSPLEGLTRAADTQKCIRAGGKHNDLDDVGKDTYHHTFFEMLGSWSFGDYFKAETIAWAWEFLTETMGLPGDRLYATYFGGDEAGGLAPDDEARELWLRHLPPERVLPGNMKDNFWEMGDTGPCGPCSELHYDRIGNRDAAALVNADDPDVLEVWNLVFIQYDRAAGGKLRQLPAKHVDTGMGLARLVSVLPDVRSNYDTDVFTHLFDAIREQTNARPYEGKLGADDTYGIDTAYRVIADHIRTLTFAITDGAVPSNEGRGYVLRRVLRRAVRYGRQKLDAKPGFFAALVPALVEQLGDAFPELRTNPDRVQAIIQDEEESFGRTLDRGIKHFEDLASHSDGTQVSGPDAFQLYDTFGFPIDLTQLMAEERGMTVDVAGFEAEMQAQRERSRASSKFGDDKPLTLDAEATGKLKHLNVKPTDDADKFHGRDIGARVAVIWDGTDFDEAVDAGDVRRIGVVLNKTNFYAEMGGQEADHGRLLVTREAGTPNGGGEFKVDDVRAFGGYVVHIGRVVRGEIRTGDMVQCHVANQRREPITHNHTATHLLNLGLRHALGTACEQRGSSVAPDRLRFDFDHAKPVTTEEAAAAETLVRAKINADLKVFAELAPLEEAKKISGLRAVFGEKYPDPVRVVSVGVPVADLLANPESEQWDDISIEFCGGVHAMGAGALGAFAIVQEEGIAKGVRRVVAVTGDEARQAAEAAKQLAERVAAAQALEGDALITEAKALGEAIDSTTLSVVDKAALRASHAKLQEKLKVAAKAKAAEAAKAAVESARALAEAIPADATSAALAIECGSDRGALQAAMKSIAQVRPDTAVILVSADTDADSLAILAQVPKPIVGRGLKAGDWVKAAAAVVGGKGGGRPEQAQGGGSGAAKLPEVLTTAEQFAADTIS